MAAGLADWASTPRCDRVEVEFVDPGRGRERSPLAACWHLRFERMSTVRGLGRRAYDQPARCLRLAASLRWLAVYRHTPAWRRPGPGVTGGGRYSCSASGWPTCLSCWTS
jgi:hypothetical protein